MEFARDLATNVLGNVVFWFGIGGAAWLAARVLQRRILRFFGLQRGGLVRVVVSNAGRGTPGEADGPRVSLSLHELWAAQSLQAFFGSTPLRLPEVVRGLVDGVWLRDRVGMKLAVGDDLDVLPGAEPGTVIVVGAGRRNELRSRYEAAHVPRAHVTSSSAADGSPDGGSIHVRLAQLPPQTIRTDLQPAVIERVTPADGTPSVFFCHGARADGSWLAVEYLIRHWRRLERTFGGDDFVVCLGCRNGEPYPTAYEEPLLLASVTA